MQMAAVAKCCEMVGGAQRVLDMTIDYVKERVQFGHPIGSFQAIRHHCSNMVIDLDGLRFITYQAAYMLSEGLPCAKEVAMAKAWTSEAYLRIVSLAQQIHGGIGFIEDHDMQFYTRRAKAAGIAYGDADYCREIVANQMGY